MFAAEQSSKVEIPMTDQALNGPDQPERPASADVDAAEETPDAEGPAVDAEASPGADDAAEQAVDAEASPGADDAAEQAVAEASPGADDAAEPDAPTTDGAIAPVGTASESEAAARPTPAAPSPAPAPGPPGPKPFARPRPAASGTEWGRVDDDGTVYVREGDGERAVGQYPDGTSAEALAYFQRKYTELAGQVTLLEQRIERGTPAADVAKTVKALSASVAGANAVGDLAALERRLGALTGTVGEIVEKQTAEQKAAVEAAVIERAALVAEAESLAAQDPAKVQWKQTSAALDDVFARWQKHQQDGPRLPKGESNELWKRFRSARTTIETNRKAFFAELDSVHKDARNKKQELVEKAEALIPQGSGGIPAYRQLLDAWRLAGRAGKKFDDALWARFKTAGDALYSAKAEVDAKDDAELTANYEQKLALLAEAEPIATEKDRTKAKDALSSVQRRWDAIGKVPRDKVKPVEDRLRRIETAVRKLDEEHWERNNPERKARSEGMVSQLEAAIQKLERELADARESGDTKKIANAQEALDARKVWLNAIG